METGNGEAPGERILYCDLRLHVKKYDVQQKSLNLTMSSSDLDYVETRAR
jgi:hypothetical protein